MAEFLTTNGVSYQIENLILNAKKNIVLVSPFLKLSKTFFERLKDASNGGVSVKIVYGKDELKPNEKNSLAELPSVELYFFENLHAKCYFNETQMVITSMNMYEFSEKNNREMGVFLDRQNDKELFEKAFAETMSIIQSSERIPLKKDIRQTKNSLGLPLNKLSNKMSVKIRGYCIRCQKRIDYNPSKPYCDQCFLNWNNFKNSEYQENVCHRCGEFETTTMSKPQCLECWKTFASENSPIY